MGLRNTLLDLNDYLFAEMERLDNERLSPEGLKREIERAKAMSLVAGSIISGASVVLRSAQFSAEWGDDAEVPRMLLGDGCRKSDIPEIRLGGFDEKHKEGKILQG